MNEQPIGVMGIIGIIIGVGIVVAGGWYLFFQDNTAKAPTDDAAGIVETILPSDVAIVYNDSGFSSKSVTVPIGTTVTFINQSAGRMWVASAMHPAHAAYDGTSEAEHCAAGYSGPTPFDQCASGTSYSFTFSKAGTWGYHNHTNPAHFGSVTVTP